MSQTNSQSRLLSTLVKQLRHPLKLRIALCTAMLTVWYVLFFGPLSEQVAATTARIVAERKRVTTARDIVRLKKSLAPFRDLGAAADVHELMRHVMQRIRSTPLRLIDLKPEKPKDLGPYEAIGLKLSLEGTFADVDQFLAWIETDKRPFRVDSIQLKPETRQAGRLSAQLTLVTLVEKAVAPAKARGEARKKP